MKKGLLFLLSMVVCMAIVVGSPLCAFAQNSDSAQTGVDEKLYNDYEITIKVGETYTRSNGVHRKSDGATWMYEANEIIRNPMSYPGFNNVVDGYRRDTWYFISASAKFTSNSEFSYSFKGLHPGKTRIQIVAIFDNSYIRRGVQVIEEYYITVISDKLATPQPKSLKNTASGPRFVFKRVAGAEKYRVFRKTSSTSWKKLGDVVTSRDYIVDKTAKKGVKYTYTVRCINAAGTKYQSGYNKTGLSIKCKK